jgi:hypothetical protein
MSVCFILCLLRDGVDHCEGRLSDAASLVGLIRGHVSLLVGGIPLFLSDL